MLTGYKTGLQRQRIAAKETGRGTREPHAVKAARAVPGRGEGGNTLLLFD
jgi:hypothetical protein